MHDVPVLLVQLVEHPPWSRVIKGKCTLYILGFSDILMAYRGHFIVKLGPYDFIAYNSE